MTSDFCGRWKCAKDRWECRSIKLGVWGGQTDTEFIWSQIFYFMVLPSKNSRLLRLLKWEVALAYLLPWIRFQLCLPRYLSLQIYLALDSYRHVVAQSGGCRSWFGSRPWQRSLCRYQTCLRRMKCCFFGQLATTSHYIGYMRIQIASSISP